MADQAIQIGELSRRTGCNIETIRYYERIGLMPAPPRRGRYRSYGGEDVGRLGFVRRARELGFTLDDVRALLGLAGGGQASCAEVRTLAASHLTDVRARIADLRRMERVLADSVRACDARQNPGCPLIQSLYAERGQSPDGLDTKIPM
jgi:MerR family transcriptional regulator, mercuric resistance operon regulatory protein